jgi:hypothetical protein
MTVVRKLAGLTQASDRINNQARGPNQPRRRQMAQGPLSWHRGQGANILCRFGRARGNGRE